MDASELCIGMIIERLADLPGYLFWQVDFEKRSLLLQLSSPRSLEIVRDALLQGSFAASRIKRSEPSEPEERLSMLGRSGRSGARAIR